MITRDLPESKTVLIRQQDHADLSAQFAAHWGNGPIAPPDPFNSMIFAATHHDDHYRELEALLPIDSKVGRPYGHRSLPSTSAHLEALRENVEWLKRRDPFAGLMVSMHHTGLPQNRYGVIKAWGGGSGGAARRRELSPEFANLIKQMESDQRTLAETLRVSQARVRFNYRQLQVFDLLSLFFCCDGFVDGALRHAQLDQTPVAFGSDEDVALSITPLANGVIKFAPYPFDSSPLTVVVMGRVAQRLIGASVEECRNEFERAPREAFTWTLTE